MNRFLLCGILLVACGEEPAFTTSQGVDVFVDKELSLVDREHTSAALQIVIDNALALSPQEAALTDYTMLTFRFHAKEELPGSADPLAYVKDGNLHFAALAYDPYCPFRALAHEMGHVYQNEMDAEHENEAFFNAEDSLENVAKPIIMRDVCGNGDSNE